MKRAIISDIHANLEALQAVMEDIEKQNVKKQCGTLKMHKSNHLKWSLLCAIYKTDNSGGDSWNRTNDPMHVKHVL